MHKTCLFVRLPLAVLSAGLVSCAKDDTKIRDNYKAPPPVINNKGSEDLKTWDRRSQKSLDLQDSFDVTVGGPAKLEVTTRCQLGQQSFFETFSFVPREPIKIFQVLPKELLTADLKNEKYNCGFELALQNALGSKHIYAITPVPITDETGGAVKVEKTGSDEHVGKIFARAMEGLRMRYRNTGAASAEILCTDMTLPPLPFEQVAEFTSFDFAKPELRSGRNLLVLSENHQQSCRALIRQAGHLHQISDPFVVQIPLPPFNVASSLIPVGSPQKLNLVLGAPIEFAAITVSNPLSSGSRYLRISKLGQPSVLRLLYPAVPGYGNTQHPAELAEYVRPWAKLLPRGTADIPVEDRGDHYLVTLAGGKSIAFAVQIQPTGRMLCRSGAVSRPSENLSVLAKIQFQEVSGRGEILENLPAVSINGSFMSIPPDRLPTLPAPTSGTCPW